MSTQELSSFAIGCIGAFAPECLRLYNLRFKPQLDWSWGYLLLSIPFVLLGGFVAWILEPSSKYAAFYAGVSTPVIVTTIARDSGNSEKEKRQLELRNQDLERRLEEAEQQKKNKASIPQNKEERLPQIINGGFDIGSIDNIPHPSSLPGQRRRPVASNWQGILLKNFWNAL